MGDGGSNMSGALVKKKREKEKQPLLCWVFEVLPPADIGVHTDKGKQAASLSLCFLSASLCHLPLSSPPHPFIFTLGWLWGSPCPPSTYHALAVQALISVRRKINSILWNYFSSYHGFNNSNKAESVQQHRLTSICYS